ncbi:MAG: hypothetical protein KC502_12665, partial [Myxococcales bacterium]|nr:hypothetical protein [Myxococcales bacterium]
MKLSNRAVRCLLTMTLITTLAACGSDPAQDTGTGSGQKEDIGADTGGLDLGDAFGSQDTKVAPDTAKVDTGTEPKDTGTEPKDTGSVTPDVTESDTTTSDAPAGSCVGFCGKYQNGSACQCDSTCTKFGDCCGDFESVCGGDTTTPDAGGQEDTSTPDDGGGAATESCQGICGKYVAGNKCQCDSGCTQYGDCCKDYDKLCKKPGCKSDSDCDDKLTCTTDKCVSGTCKNTPDAKMCVIDGACHKEGATDTNTCLVCKPGDNQEDWTVDLAATCDDGNSCTSGDTCQASGACSGTKTGNCCAKNADCTDGNACSEGTCDLTKGTCSFKAKAGCCKEGVCCDLSSNTAKSKGTPCSTESQSVEYKCDGKQVQKREAFPSCDGSSVGTCPTAKANWSWTGWQTIQTCTADQTCKAQSGGAPICEGGTSTGCKGASDCDDSNTCTKDSCSAGKCSHQAIAGCCTFASDCDDGNACTVDLCEGNKCSSAATPCVPTADCEVAACDAKTGACNISVKAGWCKVGDQCAKDGSSNPANSCQTCSSTKSQSAWSVTSTCACSSGACCDVGSGVIKDKAAKCDDTV